MNKMKMKTCMMTLAGLVLAMAASAQNFGLSDLHQMRGRVGRSNKKHSVICWRLH